MKDKIVFTNGCFDIIHVGHIHLLSSARNLGDRLIVGLNSDQSIKRIKGDSRPIQTQESRKLILESLRFVDEVIIFNEDDPLSLIKEIKPDILVKGGDYSLQEIIGADFVLTYGGEVEIIDYIDGYSSTSIIDESGK